MSTYKDGAFVFYRTSAACVPMLPSEIEWFAKMHSIPATIVPAYAGDRQQVSRAISQVSGHVAKKGWELTSIKTGRHEVVYGISAVAKDQERERVDFTFDDRLRWSGQHGNGKEVEGAHHIAHKVNTAYQALRGRVCPGDWTESLTTYLLTECQAFPFREDGRIYWVPPQTLGKLASLGAFLASVGINLVCCEVQSETKTVVTQAAAESLADKLQSLQEEVDAFDGNQKPSNYKRRIEEFQALRKRATTYHEALGIGVEQAQAILNILEGKVQGLLSIREATVLHRDGSTSSGPVSQSAVWEQEQFSW